MILINNLFRAAVISAFIFTAPLSAAADSSAPEKENITVPKPSASDSAVAEKENITGQTASADEIAAPRDSLYKASGAIMIIWLGISLYLFSLDRKVSRLEKEINEK